ncbi:18836_t:CDS:2 [Dentiscutata erythropus]|uniref:18836_t:CDS:1 n=1 Tax=Dentiscutata erythropus TaxID=1348616 RepID=A0A9N9HDL4_9GLOM|nr:18836_t:CDS:2 [Dentiscutata erythropus]
MVRVIASSPDDMLEGEAGSEDMILLLYWFMALKSVTLGRSEDGTCIDLGDYGDSEEFKAL